MPRLTPTRLQEKRRRTRKRKQRPNDMPESHRSSLDRNNLRNDRLLKFLFAVCASLVLAPTINAASTQKPNVLFIAVDDLNDWIGCLGGHPQAKTPNIDRLAKRGVLFTHAQCAAPLCNPSRAAVFSG